MDAPEQGVILMSIETIQRKGDTRFRAVVRIGHKKVSKTFRRKIDAKKWEAETKVRGVPDASIAALPMVTLSELMDRFEREHCEVRNARSTQIMNRSLYENYLAIPFGAMSLPDLSATALEVFLVHLHRDKGTSVDRINRIRQLLHVMLNRAVG